MLERLAEDQEQTTFTCLFDTYAFRKMPFGLSNVLATFQRYMISIFSNLVDRCLEILMNEFSVYKDSFGDRLANFRKVLRRC